MGGGGGGQKAPLTSSFSPVTSANMGIISQNFLTFSSNPFVILMQNFKTITSPSPQIIKLEPRAPVKKVGFSGQPNP